MSMPPMPELVRRIEILLDKDNDPVDDIKNAVSKYVTLYDENGDMEDQYSVDIIDGIDQEFESKCPDCGEDVALSGDHSRADIKKKPMIKKIIARNKKSLNIPTRYSEKVPIARLIIIKIFTFLILSDTVGIIIEPMIPPIIINPPVIPAWSIPMPWSEFKICSSHVMRAVKPPTTTKNPNSRIKNGFNFDKDQRSVNVKAELVSFMEVFLPSFANAMKKKGSSTWNRSINY